MNINQINESNFHIQNDYTQKAADITNRDGQTPNVRTPNDQADLSEISSIMEKSLQDIDRETDIRPEKIDAMRSFADSDAVISDSQIDQIMIQMLQS